MDKDFLLNKLIAESKEFQAYLGVYRAGPGSYRGEAFQYFADRVMKEYDLEAYQLGCITLLTPHRSRRKWPSKIVVSPRGTDCNWKHRYQLGNCVVEVVEANDGLAGKSKTATI